MRKKFTVFICIILSVLIAAGFTSCTSASEDESTEEFAAALLEAPDIPVSESEIIAFYNELVSAVQKDSGFTSKNKPGVKTTESIKAGDIEITSLDGKENAGIDSLNSAAKEIKDRIISGIDTSVPVIPFGDMGASVSSVIYPYDSDEVKLSEADVISADCTVNGSSLDISMVLTNSRETVENVFGVRDKAAVLDDIHLHCADYAEINDYSIEYVNDDENDVHSTINLSVETEKQSDGTYKCTGRIISLSIKIVCDVKAQAICKGSFADNGSIEISFRFTDEKKYEFDWLGTSTWEPTSEN